MSLLQSLYDTLPTRDVEDVRCVINSARRQMKDRVRYTYRGRVDWKLRKDLHYHDIRPWREFRSYPNTALREMTTVAEYIRHMMRWHEQDRRQKNKKVR
jgi:hypothetical protein